MCENGHLGLHIVLTKCIFYTKEVSFTIVFYYNLYKTGSFAQNLKKKQKKYKIMPSWPFLRLSYSGCVPSPNVSSVPENVSLDRVSKAQ